MLKKLLLTCMALFTTNIYATNCTDKITNVTTHSNGNIYFSTEKVCSAHWCVLGIEKWNTSDKLKSALSALLTANTTKNEVVLEWDSAIVPNCATIVADYATPGFILLK